MPTPKPERQIWDELVTDLDCELLVNDKSRHRLGEILYRLKAHLHKHGLDKARTGRWESLLRERKIEKNTARDLVVAYQIKECIPESKCFYPKEVARMVNKKEKSHQRRENNRTGTVLLEENEIAKAARIEFADDHDPDNRDINGRAVVECFFVLTQAEKLEFLSAVHKLTDLRATQIMYEAVVRAVPKGELHEEDSKAASV